MIHMIEDTYVDTSHHISLVMSTDEVQYGYGYEVHVITSSLVQIL